MIKILKEGKIQKPIRIIYKRACNHCGCEFEFEKGDCDYVDKALVGNVCFYTMKCPYCKKTICGNNLYDLEYREEVE